MGVKELIKGKKYKVIVEAGTNPATGKRKRVVRTVNGRKMDAEKLYSELLYELEHGTYIEPTKTTLSEYLNEWLESYAKNKAPSTYQGYHRIVKSHINQDPLGSIELAKLQPMHIQSYYSRKLENGKRDNSGGLSPTTIRRHHALIHKALDQAAKMDLINRNPASLTEPPPPNPPEIFPLNPDELDELIYDAREHRDIHLIIFASFTGMRQGELLALEWQDTELDIKEPYCRVRQTVGYINGRGFVFRPIAKNKKARREIALPDIAVDALKNQAKMIKEEMMLNRKDYNTEKNLVFPDKYGRPQDPSEVSRRFSRLAKKSGYKNVRFHDLRHTHATILFMQNEHPKVVQERLGHQTIGITMDTYTHYLKGMQQSAVNKLNSYTNERHQNGTKQKNGR